MKAKNLTDHGAPALAMNWSDGQLMYDYYRPATLPEFDSFKSSTISTELEHLLRRIVQVIPAELKPSPEAEELIDSYLSDSTSNPRVDELGEGSTDM